MTELDIAALKCQPISKIHEFAKSHGIENLSNLSRQDLVFNVVKQVVKKAETPPALNAEGVLEVVQDGGYGFLRSSSSSYQASADDVYVPPSVIRKYGLRTGDSITCQVRIPDKGERYFAMTQIKTVNFMPVGQVKRKVLFRDLTAEFPTEWLKLERGTGVSEDLTGRMIDMLAPIGKGQRALIVSPPKAGKTVMLQTIAHAITSNHPECKLIVLLIDERPEEVTDMAKNVKGEVVASTFDEAASRHIQVTEMVMAKAKRLVENNHDVVILLDSITRLARAYNTVTPASGKVLTGGVDANALQRPKRVFGAARNTVEKGSLTIIGTVLVGTGSKMDDVIFEEFKGTGNNEIVLERHFAQKRIFPAINVDMSSTRRDDMLRSKEDLTKGWVVRKLLQNMEDAEGLEWLLTRMKKSKTNNEFFDSMKS